MLLLSPSMSSILNLAIAREIVLLDAQHCMPKNADAVAQRQKMISGLELVIDEALAQTAEPILEVPVGLTDVGANAYAFIVKARYGAVAKPLPTAYANLRHLYDLRADLDQANELVSWVDDTRLIPGVTTDDIDNAAVATTQFIGRLLSDMQVGKWLKAAQGEELNDIDKRNLWLMRMEWMQAVGLGEENIQTFARARANSYSAWRVEKKKADDGHPELADYNAWLPTFKIMLSALRERGEALGKAFRLSPYEATMVSFNRGLDLQTVNDGLAQLAKTLPKLARVIIAKQQAEEPPIPLPFIAEADQMIVVRALMEKLGLDKNHARADQAAHPGSYMQWAEQRVTVRQGENRPLLSRLIGLIHETGHEKYAQNLPLEWKDQPIGGTNGMWVHESQSLFWEREVAFTRPFMRMLSKLIREELGGKYDMSHPAWDAENLFRHAIQVLPNNPIRTEADDVTYSLHIIVRHQVCQKLFDGTLAPEDAPAMWNKAYQDILGVTVHNFMEGIGQDMQMSWGNFTNFPGYTFGRLGAAMLGKAIRAEMNGRDGHPDFETLIENGEFGVITQWLTDKVHGRGSRYDGVELLEQATGMEFSAEPYLAEICERYGLRNEMLRAGPGREKRNFLTRQPNQIS